MTNSILTKTAIALATALTIGGATAALANQKAPSHQVNGAAAYGFVQGGQAQKARAH